jgi:hypothetical protein
MHVAICYHQHICRKKLCLGADNKNCKYARLTGFVDDSTSNHAAGGSGQSPENAPQRIVSFNASLSLSLFLSLSLSSLSISAPDRQVKELSRRWRRRRRRRSTPIRTVGHTCGSLKAESPGNYSYGFAPGWLDELKYIMLLTTSVLIVLQRFPLLDTGTEM